MPTDPADLTADELERIFEISGYRQTMGMRIVRLPGHDPRESIVECDVSPPYANTQGVAHGGLISGLIDTAAGVATKLAAGDAQMPVATVSLTVNYHRPGRVGRKLRAVGRSISGTGTVSCAIEVHDDHGEHIASGMATLRARPRGANA
jgi:uncharacterized protein (TIGR00369 family)